MKTLTFLDTETTSLEEGRLIELAYTDAGTIEVILCKPPVPITYEAMAVHHITEGNVINMPVFGEHPLYGHIKDIVKDTIVIAHNAQFDLDVLEREGIEHGEYVDTKRVAMHLYPDAKNHRLQYLRYYLGVDVPHDESGLAHSAGGDVRVLMAVFEKMKIAVREDLGVGELPESSVIAKMIELTRTPVLLTIIPFGKHAGKTFKEINREDRGYIEWMHTKMSDKSEDLAYTVSHWMNTMSL